MGGRVLPGHLRERATGWQEVDRKGRKVSIGEKQPLTSCSFLLDTTCSELLLGLLGPPWS